MRYVILVDGAEVRGARGPLVEAAQEGVGRGASAGGITNPLLLPVLLRICSVSRYRRGRRRVAGVRFAGPDGPVPVDALVPVALALRDVVADELVAAGAVAVAVADVAAADALLLCVGDGGEEAAGEVEDGGRELGR